MRSAAAVEWWKLKASMVTVTIAAVTLIGIPIMSYGMFWVAVNGGFGPLAAKTSGLIVGEGWHGYLNAAGQITAVAWFLAVGVGSAWVFGREFVDGTFPSLFALAVSKSTIATAKFIILLITSAGVSIALVAATAGIGFLGALPPLPAGELISELVNLLVIAVLASWLGITNALVASAGRGYLPAIGMLIAIIAVAQMAVLFGTGGWFPYAVPGLLAASDAAGVPAVSAPQIAMVPLLLSLVGWWTVRWWQRAEAV